MTGGGARAEPEILLERERNFAAGSVLRGVAVTVGANYTVRLTNLFITVLLARAVSTEGMGIIAAALLAVEVFDTIRDFGLREAVVVRPDASRRFVDTAFAVIIAVGVVQTGAMLLLAPEGTRLVNDPMIVPVLQVLSVYFLLNALGTVQEATLQREGLFGRRALAETVAVGVKAATAVTLILWGAGIWSLVVAILASAATRSTCLWFLAPWRSPVHLPSWSSLRELSTFGSRIVFINVTHLIRGRSDQAAILMLLGPTALGVYFVAARIPDLMVTAVNSAVTTVTLPKFSHGVASASDLRGTYARTLKTCMLLIAPVSVGVAAVSGSAVELLFGADWAASADVLAALALNGIAITLGWSAGDVLKALNRPGVLARVIAAEFVTVVPLIWITAFVTGSVLAVAAAVVVGNLLASLLRVAFVAPHIDFGFAETILAVWAPIVASFAMGAAVITLRTALPGFGPLGELTVLVLAGVVSYAVFLALFDYNDLRDLYRRFKARPLKAE